jgi:peptidoglycan/LPS O-acetylase OafA/YrhL
MRKHTSLYLDALRICAAVAVFFSHVKRDGLSANNSVMLFLGQFGQEGVAIFFVISGIVIAFVAREKEQDFRSYVVARLGRLWSVIVPALILTVILDVAGRAIAPAMYAEPEIQAWSWDFASLWNFLGPLLFLNKVSFASAVPGTNGPFWSLCFEFWYYILFGVAYYLRGLPRILLLGAVAAIAGPTILALFPIWAFGLLVYVYLKHFSRSTPGAGAWALSCSLLVALLLLKYKIASFAIMLFPETAMDVTDLAGWISHFAVGIACAINIIAYDACGGVALLRTKVVEDAVRFLAARSFSLYLYQAPCIFFFGALTYGMSSSVARIVIVIVLSLATILFLSELTEKRKKWFVSLADGLIPGGVPQRAKPQVGHFDLEDEVLAK